MLDSKFICTLQLSPLCSLRFDSPSPLSFSSIMCGDVLLRKDALWRRCCACNVPSSVPSSDCSVVSRSATPRTAAPRRLCPWDSPGKNTGVGCHFLLPKQCMYYVLTFHNDMFLFLLYSQSLTMPNKPTFSHPSITFRLNLQKFSFRSVN